MQIILTEDIEKLGNRGDVVKVAAGYGRNYLLPRGLAVRITPGNLKQIEHEKRILTARARKERVHGEAIKAKLELLELTFKRKVGDSETLYGSVTNVDVAEAIAAHGFDVDRRKIVLEEPIRELGSFRIVVKLMADVQAELKVDVVSED